MCDSSIHMPHPKFYGPPTIRNGPQMKTHKPETQFCTVYVAFLPPNDIDMVVFRCGNHHLISKGL